MNTLTKVFVVLLVIFSIAFTMMSIQFSASVPDWRAQAETWKVKAQEVDTINRNLIAAKVAESARAAYDRSTWAEQKREMTEQMEQLRRELNDNRDLLARAQSELTAKDATVQKLTAELGIAQASAEKARTHRSELEGRSIEREKTALDLNEALNEKIATIIVLEQQTRQQEQAINLLKQERDKLLKKLRLREAGLEDSIVTVPTDKVRPTTVARVTPIRGHIQRIDGQFASITVGRDDGVEPDMIFIIYNESGYLGDLEITDVDPKQAAGVLKFVNGPIRAGDRVADESGYLAMK